jgi:dienelactone hydrolase
VFRVIRRFGGSRDRRENIGGGTNGLVGAAERHRWSYGKNRTMMDWTVYRTLIGSWTIFWAGASTGARRRRLSGLFFVLSALSLTACDGEMLNRSEMLNPSVLTEDDSDIARTFDQATIVLPRQQGQEPLIGKLSDKSVREHLLQLPKTWRYPTILYMHGCTGQGGLDTFRTFAKAGFAVIAPNSFARRYRPLQCSPSKQTGGQNIFVFDFRLVEVSYALHRMVALRWINNDRLFLVGTSEGGVAAALYRGAEFRARIITQWTCHGAPFIRGLAAPSGEAVLAIVRSDDPWYQPDRTEGQLGDCSAFFKTPERSRSLVIDGGAAHDVWGHPSTMRAAIEFLRGQ